MTERTAPVIGVTCGHDRASGQDRWFVKAAYIRAVVEAGGIPLLVGPTGSERLLEEALARVDGLLLIGGIDVDPALYGQERHPCLGDVDGEWDSVDVTAARIALRRDLPLLGICRGVQVLNVAAGGSLYQDIPSEVPGAIEHSREVSGRLPRHSVSVAQGSRLHEFLGMTWAEVNSSHHQAVRDVAPGFRAVAHAPDGVIEAIESPDHRFALGVQWHPELMVGSDPAQRRLFAALVRAAMDAQVHPATPGR